MSGCPFSHSVERDSGLDLRKHALQLSSEGIGPVSRMLRESLIETEPGNANLPQLHATEAAKFAAMAKRIVPAEFFAAQLIKDFADIPAVAILTQDVLCQIFYNIVQRTEVNPIYSPQNNGKFTFSFKQTSSYLDFCAKQPELLLTCHYLSVGLQKLIFDLTRDIDDATVSNDVEAFGTHFNASNLLSTFPLALYLSFARQNKEGAKLTDLNNLVISDAFKHLHDEGRFSIRVNGMANSATEGKVAIFNCPMEGYLFNLLCNNQVLESIFSSIGRANTELTSHKQEKDRDPLRSLTLLAHQRNIVEIKQIAEAFLLNI